MSFSRSGSARGATPSSLLFVSSEILGDSLLFVSLEILSFYAFPLRFGEVEGELLNEELVHIWLMEGLHVGKCLVGSMQCSTKYLLIYALLCHCLGYLVNMMCIYFTWPNEVHVERQSRVWTMAWMTLAIR